MCIYSVYHGVISIKFVESSLRQALATTQRTFFNHGNLQSFVRQLNMYDFHKVSLKKTHRQSTWQCFQHEYFRKSRPDLLERVKRKSSHPSAAASASSRHRITGSPGVQNRASQSKDEVLSTIGDLKDSLGSAMERYTKI